MMLANLLNVPRSDAEWQVWSYSHRSSHDQIRAAIQAKKKVNLPDYVIDPISSDDPGGFLERNQQLHDDMDGILGVQGVDLQDVDLADEHKKQAWIYLHYQEHLTASLILGIS